MNARRATIKEPVPLEDEVQTEAEVEDAPELDGVRPGDDEVPEGDLKFDGEEPEDEEPEPWHSGHACLNCGAKDYRLTVGWGQACDKCLVPEDD